MINGDEVINISDMSSDWRKSTHEFMGTGGLVEITFEDTGISDSYGTFLDKVTIKSKKVDGERFDLKWAIKILKGIMTGEIKWVHWDSIKQDTIPAGDTLSSLECADGEIAVYNINTETWECGTGGGGGDNLGNHIATKDLDMATFDINNIQNIVTGTIEDASSSVGTSGQVLSSTGSSLQWIDPPSGAGDNLGDHTATQDLDMATLDILNIGTITCDDSSGCIPGAFVTDESVGQDEIAPGAVSSSEVEDESLTSADIADNTISSDDIEDQTITSDDIDDEAVGIDQLADDSVDGDKVIDESLTGDDIEDGSITSDDIEEGAIGLNVNVVTQLNTGLGLPSGSPDTETVSAECDEDYEKITGFYLLDPSNQGPFGVESFSIGGTPQTIDIDVLNQGPSTLNDVVVVIFCTSTS